MRRKSVTAAPPLRASERSEALAHAGASSTLPKSVNTANLIARGIRADELSGVDAPGGHAPVSDLMTKVPPCLAWRVVQHAFPSTL